MAVKNELKIVSNIFKDKLNINDETLLSQEREVNKNLKLI
jgi:hypothetical protein